MMDASLEIMRLAQLVNSSTNFTTFVSFSGHVQWLEVRIARSRDKYDDVIYRSEKLPTEPWREDELIPSEFSEATFEFYMSHYREASRTLMDCLSGDMPADAPSEAV